MRKLLAIAFAAATLSLFAEVVRITDVGVQKLAVSIGVTGPAAADYTRSLKRNLELSGLFLVKGDGSIKVHGTVGGDIVAEGRGKAFKLAMPAADAKAARMAARRLADEICAAWGNGARGFARDRIAFVNRKGAGRSELCAAYPDGADVVQLTGDSRTSVGPRWKDRDTLFYTGYLSGGPQIFELNTATGRRQQRWNFRGLATGATVSPDGRRVAAILSFRGNPDLYVIDIASGRWTQLTATAGASEGQPVWSPDGREIAYVSDETRHPQIYVIDVATRKKRRLTARGTQNVDPDWGPDGRLAYVTKRGGKAQIAVLDPKRGDESSRLIGESGTWEHPSWARDARHLVAGRDKSLFIVDTLDGGDMPAQLFSAAGNWITPSWQR